MLIVVGVIITNLWLSLPFDFELFVQISSVIGSLCTIIALLVAVQALNEWKRTYAYTKADTKFEELQTTYWDLSGAFNDFFYKESELLEITASQIYTVESEEKRQKIKSDRDKAQQLFESEVRKFKKIYIQLQPSIHSLDGDERNRLECIDSDWWSVIQKLDLDTDTENTNDFSARLEQRNKAYSMLKDVNKRNTSLLEKVRNEIQGKLKF